MTPKKWLEDNMYYGNIDEAKLKNIFYFTLVWNIFEKECCNKNALIGTYPKKLAEKLFDKIDVTVVNTIYDYFKNRYIVDSDVNDIFISFDFGKEHAAIEYKAFVQEKLLSHVPDNKEKLQALLYIAFRLRNNLYHGIKKVEKLYEQNENFKQINTLLMAIVDNKRDCE